MSVIKVLEATVKDGVVNIQDSPADDVLILSAGGSESSGFVLVTPDRALYIVNTQPDLQHTIDQLVAVIDQIKTVTDANFVTAATGAVLTKPFTGVSSQLDSIKQELEGYALK